MCGEMGRVCQDCTKLEVSYRQQPLSSPSGLGFVLEPLRYSLSEWCSSGALAVSGAPAHPQTTTPNSLSSESPKSTPPHAAAAKGHDGDRTRNLLITRVPELSPDSKVVVRRLAIGPRDR